MSGLNQCSFIGNLGRDPEVRHSSAGNPIVNLSLAVSETWKDKTTGERKEKTEWIRIVVFNEKLGEIIQKYLKKGSKIYIEGAMQTRKYTDQSGVEKYSTEIVLGNYAGKMIMLGDKNQQDSSAEPMTGSLADQSGGGDLDDNISFAAETR